MPVGLNPLPKEQECQWDLTPSPRSRSASGTFGCYILYNDFKEPLELVKAQVRNMLILIFRVMDKDTIFGHAVLNPGQMIPRYFNIFGRNMLRTFGHPYARSCDMFGILGSGLTIFKLEPTTAYVPNMSQHIATRWLNGRNMLRPTMLRCVALASCDSLAGALGCWMAFFIFSYAVI